MFLTGKDMRSILARRVPGYTKESYLDALTEAYSQLAESRSWTFLEIKFNLVTKAYESTGGANFTNGSTSITAATSVSAGWSDGESSGYTGMYIKKSDEAGYYNICASDSVEITIASNYDGITTTAAASSGDGYYIFQHIYAIDSNVETVTHLMGDGYLENWDEKEIEMKDAQIDENGEPSKWRHAGNDTNGNTLIEIFPRLIDDVYVLRGKGKKRISKITDSTKPLLDSYLILAFTELDLLRRKRIISPDAVSDDMLTRAENRAEAVLSRNIANDIRKRGGANYTPDRFFGRGHRGQKWIVQHDPWEA